MNDNDPFDDIAKLILESEDVEELDAIWSRLVELSELVEDMDDEIGSTQQAKPNGR